jgi:hypothetical protein
MSACWGSVVAGRAAKMTRFDPSETFGRQICDRHGLECDTM